MFITIIIIFQDGLTPIFKAAMYGHTETCELLLKHGANVTSADKVF